jgi:hypothetical protein
VKRPIEGLTRVSRSQRLPQHFCQQWADG